MIIITSDNYIGRKDSPNFFVHSIRRQLKNEYKRYIKQMDISKAQAVDEIFNSCYDLNNIDK